MKSRNKKKTSADSASVIAALDFFAEAGLLKHVKRSGWWVAGIKDPESVAEHSFRCAVMGYYLAHLEKADAHKVMLMTLFNDIHEARINDLHKMGHYYIDFKQAEREVFNHQMARLDRRVSNELKIARKELERQHTKESIIARDADILECLLQAKEYVDWGYTGARKFFQKAPKYLKTKSAKAIWKRVKDWHSARWWEDIVKFER